MSQGKKISDSVWEVFPQVLHEYFGSIAHTCKALDLDRKSYYNKRLNDPAFARKVDEVYERIEVPLAEEMLRADVLERKKWAIRFTLERASRKWHPKHHMQYLHDLQLRLINIEEQLELKNAGKEVPKY